MQWFSTLLKIASERPDVIIADYSDNSWLRLSNQVPTATLIDRQRLLKLDSFSIIAALTEFYRQSRRVLRFGSATLDLSTLQLSSVEESHRSNLSPKEALIFRRLVECLGESVGRQQLSASLWDGHRVSQRTLDSHISRLRKKVQPFGLAIESIYGQGYRIQQGTF